MNTDIQPTMFTPHALPPELMDALQTAPITPAPPPRFSVIPLLCSGLGAIMMAIVLFIASQPKAQEQPLLSPLTESPVQAIRPTNTKQPAVLATSVPPSSYLYKSQSIFADAYAKSQNRNQTDTDRHTILQSLQDAINTISEGIKTYPNNAELWAHRGSLYASIVKITEKARNYAISDYSQAFKLSPQQSSYAKTIARLLLQTATPDLTALTHAEYFLEKASMIDPKDPQTLYDLARTQTATGNLELASQTYTKLIPLVLDETKKQSVLAEKDTVERLIIKDAATRNGKPRPTHIPGQAPAGLEADPTVQAMNLLTPQDGQTAPVLVASTTESTSPYETAVDNSGVSGKATIPAGQTAVIVDNKHITTSSPIYLTPISKTNQLLTISNKKESDHFTVRIDKPEATDIVFQYWIAR